MQGQVEAHVGRHPDAEVYRGQPGLGQILAARVLAEFGDNPTRSADARSRKNYAATSPITRQSGKKKLVLARYVHNDRLIDALQRQAYCALSASAGARADDDQRRGRGVGTTPPCASSPTAWSASSTAASRRAPPTTRQPPGPTATRRPQLDNQTPWDVCQPR
jgi:Transposase IS116/IS110/IS902 family